MHGDISSDDTRDRSRESVREHVSADVAPELFTAVDDESQESPAEATPGRTDRT